MESQKEGSILDMVEIQTVRSANQVECSYEGSFVTEKGPVDEIRACAIFCCTSGERNGNESVCDTFSMTVYFCELKQGVGMVGLCA